LEEITIQKRKSFNWLFN